MLATTSAASAVPTCRASLRRAQSASAVRPQFAAVSPALSAIRRQRRVACGSSANRSVVCAVKEIAQKDFESEVLKADLPVLVDFWATWCGPCKLISKIVDQVDAEYAGKLKVVKIETDPNPELVEKYGVYGLPTIMLFKEGKAVEGSKREGAISKDKLVQYLKSHGVA